jgi:ABC-type uncharacterized transport system substrate-binding protein
MRRRDFISLLSGIAAGWPLSAFAQQPALPVIGFVSNVPRESYAGLMPAFARGLDETGFAEGRNVTFDYRWIDSERAVPALAAEMVSRNPALIMAVGGTASALALKQATTMVPIVFLIGGDPVRFGLVPSLNRPGGNITGVTSLSNALAAKQLEMVHELVRTATTLGLLINPDNPNAEHDAAEIRKAAEIVGQKLIVPIGRRAERCGRKPGGAARHGAARGFRFVLPASPHADRDAVGTLPLAHDV